MKNRLMMVLLTSTMLGQASLAQADGLANVDPIPELAELEKQAQAQEEKVKAFAEEMAKKKAEQAAPEAPPKPAPVAKPAPEKTEAKVTRVEAMVIKAESEPKVVEPPVANSAPEPAPAKPKKVRKAKPKKPVEPPVDAWTAQERQYAYP